MNSTATAKSTAGGDVSIPTQPASGFTPPRPSDRTSRGTPAPSPKSAERPRSRRPPSSPEMIAVQASDAHAAGGGGANSDVGFAREHRLEDRAELLRVVLAVAVEAYGEVEAVLVGVAEAGLDGAADPEVERQPDHLRAARARDLGGPVDRAVV